MFMKDFMGDEIRKTFEKISKSFSDNIAITGNLKAISDSFSRITESIDWETIKELSNNQRANILQMSKYGWTISPNMSPSSHMVVKDLDSMEEIDDVFTKLYLKEDEPTLFSQDVAYIKNHIGDQHKELFVQCIINFENGNYIITIPSLLSLIEGTIASMFETSQESIKIKFKESCDEKSEFLIEIAKLSVSNLLNEYLFITHEFSKERRDELNRHWVLHGRDDVRLWKKVDALKLINNLSTVLFIKDQNSQE